MIKIDDIKVGAKVVHINNINNEYVIVENNARTIIKDEIINCICYRPLCDNKYNLFVREINDFMNNFELIKD